MTTGETGLARILEMKFPMVLGFGRWFSGMMTRINLLSAVAPEGVTLSNIGDDPIPQPEPTPEPGP